MDVGCGTGTFAIPLASQRADAEVKGVDGDPQILALARRKEGAGAVEWCEGLAQALPFEDASADAVTISLVLHHLLPEDKRASLTEIRRILKTGGRLYVADWGKPTAPSSAPCSSSPRRSTALIEPPTTAPAGCLPSSPTRAFLSGALRALSHGIRSLELLTADA